MPSGGVHPITGKHHLRRRPRRRGFIAPFVTDGPMNGCDLPGLCRADAGPGTAAGRHRDHGQPRRPQGRRRRGGDRGGGRPRLRYLPPYSPDLNPIEQAFAKLKALLRKAAERTVDGLWNAIGQLLDLFHRTECANYLANSGYPRSA